jgi:hypothetical protein
VKKKGARYSSEEIERLVIDQLGKGPKTAYQLDEDLKARAQYVLPRIRDQGFIKSYEEKDWPAQGKTRKWGLTVRGFLRHLYFKPSKSTPALRRELIRDAELYQDLLKYRITVPTSQFDDEKNIAYLSSETTERPLLPIKLQRIFRDRIGDQAYADCLTYCAVLTDLWRPDILREPSKRFLKRLRKRSPSSKNQIRIETDIADSFTLSFLLEFFAEIEEQYAKAGREEQDYPEEKELLNYLKTVDDKQDKKSMDKLRRVHPDEYWFNYLKTLFEKEKQELQIRKTSLENIEKDVLAFFNPYPKACALRMNSTHEKPLGESAVCDTVNADTV